MKKNSLFLVLVLLTSFAFNSCIKQSYQTPPNASQFDPNLPTQATLLDLNNMAVNMNTNSYRVLGDTTIYGVVTADDRSGNFYKQIIIQDSTGGICLCLDDYDLYNNYPQNRKIYINLKGLILVNYDGLPEIAFSVTTIPSFKVSGIPSSLISNYVTKGPYPYDTVKSDTVRITDLAGNPDHYYNRLITFTDAEYVSSFVGNTYAGSNSSSNVYIQVGCPVITTFPFYNSSYATFQPAIIPDGEGYITCIYSAYNGPQLLLRDTSDVRLTQSRGCP